MTDSPRPNEGDFHLAGDFPAADYQHWVAEVEKALKGAPFDKRMLHRGYDGLTVKPIYTQDDWSAEGDPSGFPGFAPFTRGARASGRTRAGWDIRQEHVAPDLDQCHQEVMTDLERGVTSIALQLDAAAQAGLDGDDPKAADLAGRGGVMAYSVDDLDHALEGVFLNLAPVTILAGAQALPAAALLFALLARRGVDPTQEVGLLATDPIGTLAAVGALPVGLDVAITQAADLACYCAKHAPRLHAITVDTSPYHDAGASDVQGLAYGLATGVAYLRALTAAGLTIDQACRQIAFTVPISCDQFASIAKLRAARLLWARVTEASGASERAQAPYLHARSDDRMMTRRDPWVNMLRTTVAGFAAAVGGAKIVTLQPYDAGLGAPDTLALRIARNTQVMLLEETHLAQVIDPAGGSWYVESLTEEMVKAAWASFQAIEAQGGMAQALTSGAVANAVAATWDARAKNLAKRRDAITGVSEFPNINETLPERPLPDLAALRKKAGERLTALRAASSAGTALQTAKSTAAGSGELTAALVDAAAAGATVGALAQTIAGDSISGTPLPHRRLAIEFETLRDGSDAHLARTGKRPQIFLANLGPIAKHTGRASFSKNFFESGGVETLTNDGFGDAESCAAAFKASGAQIAILCSADPIYASLVESVAPALKGAGCTYLFLAGAPGEKKDAYLAAGVDDFIFMGGDVLATLRKTHGLLGVTA